MAWLDNFADHYADNHSPRRAILRLVQAILRTHQDAQCYPVMLSQNESVVSPRMGFGLIVALRNGQTHFWVNLCPNPEGKLRAKPLPMGAVQLDIFEPLPTLSALKDELDKYFAAFGWHVIGLEPHHNGDENIPILNGSMGPSEYRLPAPIPLSEIWDRKREATRTAKPDSRPALPPLWSCHRAARQEYHVYNYCTID